MGILKASKLNREGLNISQGKVRSKAVMVITNVKGEITSLLETLPEPKLITVLDFVQFLAQRESSEVWLQAQLASAAYENWLSSENDVYDEVFANVHPAR